MIFGRFLLVANAGLLLKDDAQYVRDNLPRVTVEDAAFPLELQKVVRKSFVQTDYQFAEKCSLCNRLSSETTALAAMIFGRSLIDMVEKMLHSMLMITCYVSASKMLLFVLNFRRYQEVVYANR